MLEEGVNFGVSRQGGEKSFLETRGGFSCGTLLDPCRQSSEGTATCTGGRGGSVLGGAAPGGSSSRGAGSAQLPPAHHHPLVTLPATWSNAYIKMAPVQRIRGERALLKGLA
jgi:hypothetical protein